MTHPKEKPYVVILAGGGGTRLWPKSRKSVPKQFLNLFSKKTLLQETYSRIAPLTDNDKIYIVASEVYAAEILKELTDLTKENIIIEPKPAGTAAAIGLASAYISKKDPNAVVHFLPADHYIPEVDQFQRTLITASVIAENQERFVIWGIHPVYPATGFEYIQSGNSVDEVNGIPAFEVKAFKERPNLAVAQAYVATGTHFWNHGNFSQKVSLVLNGIKQYMPELYSGLMQITDANENREQVAEEVFSSLTDNVSFDIGVMVKVKGILMIPVNYTWSDIGSWEALHDISVKDEDENSILLGQGEYFSYDTHGCLVHTNGKSIATIGIDDMIIIDTENIILICPKSRSQDVKKIVEQLKEKGKTEYL